MELSEGAFKFMACQVYLQERFLSWSMYLDSSPFAKLLEGASPASTGHGTLLFVQGMHT